MHRLHIQQSSRRHSHRKMHLRLVMAAELDEAFDGRSDAGANSGSNEAADERCDGGADSRTNKTTNLGPDGETDSKPNKGADARANK